MFHVGGMSVVNRKPAFCFVLASRQQEKQKHDNETTLNNGALMDANWSPKNAKEEAILSKNDDLGKLSKFPENQQKQKRSFF